MINPFAYWPIDPNGYLKHIIIGALLTLLLLRFNFKTVLVVVFTVAVCKEIFDATIKQTFFSVADAVLTVAPILLAFFLNSLKIKNVQ